MAKPSKNGKSRQGKGGGPKTEAGMAIARLNALKHGFASRSPIIPGLEKDPDWLRHHAGIVASLKPEGYLEEVLTRRIATALWELDRLTSYQVAATMDHIGRSAFDAAIAANYLSGTKEVVDPTPEDIAERQQARLLPPGSDLLLIMRYASHLHRLWVQTLHELEALQARRLGNPTHVLRVDFSGPPAS